MKEILEDVMLSKGNDEYTYTIFNEHNNKHGDILWQYPTIRKGLL